MNCGSIVKALVLRGRVVSVARVCQQTGESCETVILMVGHSRLGVIVCHTLLLSLKPLLTLAWHSSYGDSARSREGSSQWLSWLSDQSELISFCVQEILDISREVRGKQ